MKFNRRIAISLLVCFFLIVSMEFRSVSQHMKKKHKYHIKANKTNIKSSQIICATPIINFALGIFTDSSVEIIELIIEIHNEDCVKK